jgi:hypothetical protein
LSNGLERLERLKLVKLIAGLNDLKRLERFERSVTLNHLNEAKRLNVWNDWNHWHLNCSAPDGSSNPRVGETKLDEIVDRNIARNLDDSASSTTPAQSWG